jgi:hypothetical protein
VLRRRSTTTAAVPKPEPTTRNETTATSKERSTLRS